MPHESFGTCRLDLRTIDFLTGLLCVENPGCQESCMANPLQTSPAL
jgi:hypothetical protein